MAQPPTRLLTVYDQPMDGSHRYGKTSPGLSLATATAARHILNLGHGVLQGTPEDGQVTSHHGLKVGMAISKTFKMLGTLWEPYGKA